MKRVIFVLAAVCLLATAAAADLDFGAYARSVGMGGAGLALISEPVAATTINPAAMGLLSRRTNFIFPSFTLRSDGASVSDVVSNFADVYNLSNDDALKLAQDFGTKDTSLNADLVTGFTFGSMGMTIDGQAMAQIHPSESFKEWASTSTLPTDTSQFYADVTGEAVVSLPSVVAATRVRALNPDKGDLWVGGRFKLLRGIAHTDRVQLPASYTPGDPVSLVTNTVLDTDKMGLGADLGFIYRPTGTGNMSYALAATNAVKPNLGPIKLETVLNAGVAGQPIGGVAWAADLVNITGAYGGNMELRAGAEYRFGRLFAVRGGYSSRAWTFGLGIAGIDVAFSGNSPFTVGRTIVF